MVLVKKDNERWRMCIDFTNLNKACPKDSNPLPNIDSLVDNASGCRLLSFLDAFSVHNQICMHPRDESKTAFMTELSSYCYKVMPFWLKNVDATYWRLMDMILTPMIGEMCKHTWTTWSSPWKRRINTSLIWKSYLLQ